MSADLEYSVELNKIRKEYGNVIANDDISLKFRKGAVTCIVGENGAGKSTLMNILYGLEPPTSGTITVNGSRVRMESSRDAIRLKIGMVHQHFMLVDELDVLENIILGMEPKKGVLVNYKKAEKDLLRLEEDYGMKVPLDAKAGDLAVGLQQKVEILKVLYRGAQIIILDEPTAVLTPQETDELFVNLRNMAESGKTVILITHHLNEVMQIADEIVVVRRGKLISVMKREETTAEELAVQMVGSALPEMHGRSEVRSDETVIQCSGLCVQNSMRQLALDHVDLEIRKGEILGIAGVSGNGQSELAQVIAGLIKADEGAIEFKGSDITGTGRRERLLQGISYIPEDRKTDGLCLDWSIEDNAIAGYYASEQFSTKMGFIKKKERQASAAEIIKEFDVRTPGAKATVGSLSGGNQQKVVIGRETIHSPDLIVAAEPTRGVDIGAISFIHNYLVDLRNKGTAILLISSDLDEIFKLSDRISVLYGGEIVKTVLPTEITREEIGIYMAGMKGRGEQ